MGVSIRASRNTRVYVPFWAAIIFWLVISPLVVAYGVAWVLVKLAILIGHAIAAARS